MRPVLLLATGAGLFAALSHAPRSSALTGTLLPMLLALAFAVTLAGRPSGGALVAGALSAFLGSVTWLIAPSLGGAVALLLAYAERTVRVRGMRVRALHLTLAAVAGTAAAALSASYASAPPELLTVAFALVAVLCTVPLLVAADDPRVVALESAASTLGPPLSASLYTAAELLRCEELGLLDRETLVDVRRSWRSLERLVLARLRVRGGGETARLVTDSLERQIAEHVASLGRAAVAATTVGAAEAGIDDRALRDVRARGEALEERSRAMVEVKEQAIMGE